MATRKSLLSVLFASIFFAANLVRAEDIQPQVENSKFQFSGQTNANAVLVRSGPSDNYYITTKLDKGAPVTVVGIKFEWLKIVPPEGSFSVVAKNLVTRDEGKNTGRISGENVNVRAGSSVVNLKVTVQCKLPKGTEVTIVGEDDAYYQIKPPPDAYLYVHQKFVDPLKQVDNVAAAKPAKPIEKPIEKEKDNIEIASLPDKPIESLANNIVAIKQPPTTQPIAIEAEFDRLEAEYAATSGKGLEDMPIAQLLAGYEGLLKDDHLPSTIRRVATAKAASLKVKQTAREELLASRKNLQDSDSKIAALRGEREGIQQRLADNIIAYTAVGTLQASTLQVGSQTLYRLTDPANGRTLCYVRSNDARFGTFLEKFVGIKGELVSETQLTVKALLATEIAAVDPAQVSTKVSAQIIPPSLLTARPAPAPAQATTGGGDSQ
jgi:SH3-like domain-containing protein